MAWGFRIKCLINPVSNRGGAIKRATLEPGEPLITYDAFVDDLDTGDSFTASVLDILVKVSKNSFVNNFWLDIEIGSLFFSGTR
jgi:hypothetical protein